jgi:hypothetical protein
LFAWQRCYLSVARKYLSGFRVIIQSMSNKRDSENYSLVIYQGTKDRSKVYLRLRKGGKLLKEYSLYGGPKTVGLRALLIVQYARAHKVDFKEAWDSDEVWV